MAKYNAGEKFILELNGYYDPNRYGMPCYGIEGTDEGRVYEAILDRLKRYESTPHEEFRPYRNWECLLEEPEDMTAEERERLIAIKFIPEEIRNSALQIEQDLLRKIQRLEKERDQIIDFLNGEFVRKER